MNYIIGGYYLVEGVHHTPWSGRAELPPLFWSISECITTLHPSPLLLSWSTHTAEHDDLLKQALALSDAQFAAARDDVDRYAHDGVLGWPSVWLTSDQARTFHAIYLSHHRNIRLLGIALPETHYQAALDEYRPPSEQSGEIGIYTMLKTNTSLREPYAALGYEILGCEVSGQFHSFACHQLEEEYRHHLGITLNPYGLLSTYHDAERATRYTNLETTGAEPVLWLPWLVFEVPL